MEAKRSETIDTKETLYRVWGSNQDISVLGVFNVSSKHDLKRQLKRYNIVLDTLKNNTNGVYSNAKAAGIYTDNTDVVTIHKELLRLDELFSE